MQLDKEVHFCGTDSFVKQFKDNLAIMEYEEAMIGTRNSEIFKSFNQFGSRKDEGSETIAIKGIASDGFSPGLRLRQIQKKELLELKSSASAEDQICVDD